MSEFDFVDAVKRTIAEQHDRIAALEAENDRLRGLVKSMYYDLTNMTFPPDWVTEYETDLRELGIEVEE